MDVVRQELSRAQTTTLMLEARVADGESRTGEAETQLGMARERLALSETRMNEILALKEQEWEAKMDSATSGVHREVRRCWLLRSEGVALCSRSGGCWVDGHADGGSQP